MRLFSHRKRPVHLGSYPLERLARRGGATPPRVERIAQAPPRGEGLRIEAPDTPQSVANAMRGYIDILDRMRAGPAAPAVAPIPEDLLERSNHLKAACYYLDATMVGTCRIPDHAVLSTPIVNSSLARGAEQQYAAGSAENAVAEIAVQEGREAWARAQRATTGEAFDHDFALLIVTGYTRDPDLGEPGGAWITATQAQRAALRGAEVGAVLVNYLRFLGYPSRLHTATASELNLDALLLEAGLAEPAEEAERGIQNPYLGDGFGAVAVSTTMALAPDVPLAARGLAARWRAHGPGWWLGVGGARPGFQGRPYRRRPFYLGPYPMETTRRVDEPTTGIDADRVPRMPKRSDMFIRAAIGDLGPKAKRELENFRMITKSPFGHAMTPVLGGMVPLQYGEAAPTVAPGSDDPVANARALKAALYYLGADLVGICEIPDYAWYSHDADGSEIVPYHKYAISILIDQGYETMEGASGDDWISGAQSMRAYLRAQLVGGVVGQHIRNLGYSARGHSVMDQDVLHIPLILLSGLGELSRIGELVLNPFVGPRFKSGVITTDMPLAVDRPIDFGLQDFCSKCNKCARECPVSAIPFGGKILFNGYEMWKPDVEKCSRYRITNSAGSMCGRCMKTCPFNLEGVLAERPFRWAAHHLPWSRKWLAALDDKVGNGRINPTKKWWWDLDSDDEGRIVPAKRSNARQLDFRSRPQQQQLACYPPALQPDPMAPPTPPDRKLGVEAYRSAAPPGRGSGNAAPPRRGSGTAAPPERGS